MKPGSKMVETPSQNDYPRGANAIPKETKGIPLNRGEKENSPLPRGKKGGGIREELKNLAP